MMMVHFEHASPIFRVEDMGRAVAFYTKTLGFQNAEWGGEDFSHVSRDGAGIYLSLGDQGRGAAWAWIGVSNARELFEDLTAKGVPIRCGPINHPWALEIQVEDPDGNVLRLGSEPEESS